MPVPKFNRDQETNAVSDSREPLGTTWGARYFSTVGSDGETADSFDYSGIETKDDGGDATLWLQDLSADAQAEADDKDDGGLFFFFDPDNWEMLATDPAPDTIFTGDFIA